MDYSEGQRVEGRRESGVERIGPFSLIAQIAGGDFTTVHLAQRQGTLGYQRLMAIKRLRPALARQPEWTQLLLDEARLSAGVRHPNIVDILDVANDSNVGVYIVMGYVEGADLEVLIARAGKERHPRYLVPPIVDALTGLHAVHTALDELGESLSMVHQAPRARHILIGIDGTSRITDFSQVSARGLIPSTLRGKRLATGYMAPEQVLVSEPVSARTDIFIVGITLWETLTGERLFDAENPALARRAILERHIPRPSEVGLRPPACFDAICMRALSRNPEQRYQSAFEMARELREAAQSASLYASASELGQWVRALASRALVERRRAIGAEDPSQEISLDAPEVQEPTPVIRVEVPPTPEAAKPIASPQAPLFTTAFLAGRIAPSSVRPHVEAPAAPTRTPTKPLNAAAFAHPFDAPSAAPGDVPVSAPFQPATRSSAGSAAKSDLKSTQIGHQTFDDVRKPVEGSPASSRDAQARSSTPLAQPSTPLAQPSMANAIAFDSTPIADHPSRVARSITVPVAEPARAVPAVDATPPLGLPAPTATLLGVSARVRSPATPPAGVAVPRGNAQPKPFSTTVKGFATPSLFDVQSTFGGAANADAQPRSTAPRKLPTHATLPEGSMLNPYGQLDQIRPQAPQARTARSADAASASSVAPTAATPKAAAPTMPMAASLSGSGTPPFTGFSGDSLPLDVPPPPPPSAAAPRGVGTAFTGFGTAPSAAASTSLVDTASYAKDPDFEAPRSARTGGARTDTRGTSDGVLPADIFARVQAARREAGDSFRPPPYASENDAYAESGRGSRLKPLLMAGVLLAVGVFGYRQWSEQPVPLPRAAAPAPALVDTALDPASGAVGPTGSTTGSAAPTVEPLAAPGTPVIEPAPFVPPVPGASPLAPSDAADFAPSAAVPPPDRVEDTQAQRPLEAVPPPVPSRMEPDDVGANEAVTPRRAASAKRAARSSDDADAMRAAAPKPAKSSSWRSGARASEPSLPDNPY